MPGRLCRCTAARLVRRWPVRLAVVCGLGNNLSKLTASGWARPPLPTPVARELCVQRQSTSMSQKQDYVYAKERGQVLGVWWSRKRVLNGGTTAGEPTTSASNPSADAGSKKQQDISQTLMAIIKELYVDYMDPEGFFVDYTGLRASDQFQRYVDLSRELTSTDLHAMDEADRKAFFLNIYNSLTIHAFTVFGRPSNFLSRLQTYATASYNIGGHVFSLNDIENGILRGNKKAPSPLAKLPFGQDDPRLKLATPIDPRIHFALNCGALSCPPIRFYDADKIDQQLDLATRGFVNSMPISEWGEPQLSQILSWYKGDFAADDRGLLEWVAKYATDEMAVAVQKVLSADKVSISYEKYNWDLNTT